MFDNLYIDDNYTDSTSFGTDYLDIDNMRVDTAMESFSLIDPEYDTDDAFYYACESLLDAIETDLEVIALEADSSKDVSKSSQSYIVHKLKMGAAKVLASLAGICNKCYKKLLSNNKGNTRRASFWKGLYDNIMKLWRKLKGLTDPNSIKQAQKETESFKDKVRNGMNQDKQNEASKDESYKNWNNSEYRALLHRSLLHRSPTPKGFHKKAKLLRYLAKYRKMAKAAGDTKVAAEINNEYERVYNDPNITNESFMDFCDGMMIFY